MGRTGTKSCGRQRGVVAGRLLEKGKNILESCRASFLVLVRFGHSRFQFLDRFQRLHALPLDRFGHL